MFTGHTVPKVPAVHYQCVKFHKIIYVNFFFSGSLQDSEAPTQEKIGSIEKNMHGDIYSQNFVKNISWVITISGWSGKSNLWERFFFTMKCFA